MPEYDAFGRKLGEDAAHPAAAPVTPPAAPASPPDDPAPPTVSGSGFGDGFDPGPRLRAIGRRSIGLAVLLGTIAVAVGVVLAIKSSIESPAGLHPAVPRFTVPSVAVTPTPTVTPETPATPAKPVKPAVGLEHRSLIRRAELALALSRLRAKHLGRPVSLRVAADRLDLQLRTAGGRLRNVQITPGPKVSEFSLSGPGFGFVQVMSWSAIDTAAPARLTRESIRRRGVPASKVNYLVATRFGNQVLWSLFFTDGTHYVGDGAGHFQRRL